MLVAKKQSAKREKQERRERREKLAKLATRGEWLSKAQAAFNRYIRERDAALPCISCGTRETVNPLRGGGWDCGHYRSRGANPELRFEELNAAKQCKRCNRQLSGNIVNFRVGLLARIGAEKLEWLEGPHEQKKYSIEDLKAITKHYREKLKGLRRREAA